MNKFQEVTEKHVKESKSINAIDKTKCVWGEVKRSGEKVLIFFEGKSVYEVLTFMGKVPFVRTWHKHKVKLLEGPRDCNGDLIRYGDTVVFNGRNLISNGHFENFHTLKLFDGFAYFCVSAIECELIRKNKIKDLPEDKQLMACVDWVKAQDYLVVCQLMSWNNCNYCILNESVLANNIKNLNGIMIYKLDINQEPIKIGWLAEQETIN